MAAANSGSVGRGKKFTIEWLTKQLQNCDDDGIAAGGTYLATNSGSRGNGKINKIPTKK